MYYYRVFVPVYLYVLPFLFPFHTPVELGSILVSAHPFSYTISLYAEKKKSEMLNFLYEKGKPDVFKTSLSISKLSEAINQPIS